MNVRIWSDEHRAWWRPNGCGYTTELEGAGTYDAQDALQRTVHCGPEKKICISPDGLTISPRAEFVEWLASHSLEVQRLEKAAGRILAACQVSYAMYRVQLDSQLRSTIMKILQQELGKCT